MPIYEVLVLRQGEFSEATKKLLADRASYECSLPYCRTRTKGPGAAPQDTASVGQASHIYSAGLDGPRGRGGLSDDELADPSNGIWTCNIHGKEIDNNKGRDFPAGLLREWKRLHEARMRYASTGAPVDRWIERVTFLRSPLFCPNSSLSLGRVTILSGTNGAGKTAICEWIAGIRDFRLLKRWVETKALYALNIELAFIADKDRKLSMEIAVGGSPKLEFDGIRQPSAPQVIDFVYLRNRYLSGELDDLHGLADAFSVDTETVRFLAERIGKSGNSRFRDLSFKPAEDAFDDEDEGSIKPNEQPIMQLLVETYSSTECFPLESLGGSVQTEVLLAFAVELAKFKANSLPALLIIDASGWGFFRDSFDTLANVIDECSKYCQLLMIEPAVELSAQSMTMREWVQYQIIVPQHGPNGRRMPATIQLI